MDDPNDSGSRYAPYHGRPTHRWGARAERWDVREHRGNWALARRDVPRVEPHVPRVPAADRGVERTLHFDAGPGVRELDHWHWLPQLRQRGRRIARAFRAVLIRSFCPPEVRAHHLLGT